MSRLSRGALPPHTHTHSAKAAKPRKGSFVRALLTGLLCTLAAAALSLLLCALIAYNSSDPDALFTPLGLGCLVLSCLVGGLGIGLCSQSAPLPCAMLCGCIFVGIGLVLGLFFGADARDALTLGLGLGASLCVRAGAVALFCFSAALTTQIKSKLQAIPRHR